MSSDATANHLIAVDPALLPNFSETTALAASLAAVSIAIFLVLPSFYSIIVAGERQAYSRLRRSTRLFAGFTVLAIASLTFSAAVLVGLIARHWPVLLLLYIQEIAVLLGVLFSMTSIIIVWLAVRWRAGAD